MVTNLMLFIYNQSQLLHISYTLSFFQSGEGHIGDVFSQKTVSLTGLITLPSDVIAVCACGAETVD